MNLPQRILRFLQAEGPSSTPLLIDELAAGLSYPRSRVWDALRELERGGLVSRSHIERESDEEDRGPKMVTVAVWSLK